MKNGSHDLKSKEYPNRSEIVLIMLRIRLKMLIFPKNDWQADFRNNFIWEELEKYNKSKIKKNKHRIVLF